jgi:hypothetical protein
MKDALFKISQALTDELSHDDWEGSTVRELILELWTKLNYNL